MDLQFPQGCSVRIFRLNTVIKKQSMQSCIVGPDQKHIRGMPDFQQFDRAFLSSESDCSVLHFAVGLVFLTFRTGWRL